MRRIKNFFKHKPYVGSLAVAVLFLTVATCLALPKTAHATGDCDDNAILYCGVDGRAAADPAGFIRQVQSNDSGDNGHHHDLVNVYSAYGLSTAQYNQFAAYARQGQACKDGNITVDGQVVGTNGNSIGRLRSYQGDNPFAKSIGGVTYYGNSNAQAFAANCLNVSVLFDSRGVAIFAVINSCGNPVGFTPRVPGYNCTALKATPVSGRPGFYQFKTSAAVANGATIQKIVYNFGDGKTYTSTNVNEVVPHEYLTSASFHASVQVYVSLPFGHSTIINGATTGCATTVVVQLPYYACLQLTAVQLPDQKFTYQFIVKGKTLYGASLKGATFTFGDGQKATVNRANSDTVSVKHSYEAGRYSVVATLVINLPDNKTTTVTSSGCATTIKAAEYGCLQLTGEQPDAANPLAYRFTAAANATPKLVTFTGVDFDFGDGTNATAVQPNGLTAVTDHTYAVTGDYTITATLHFKVNGVVKSDTCTAAVSKTVTPECRPGVPANSVLCTPCQYNNQLPADSPQCITSLPNTGAGDVIAISGVVAVIGFFFYRQFIFRKHVFHTGNGTLNMLLGETSKQHHAVKREMAHHTTHRNKQGLNHDAHYAKPHRFRPRSHDK